MSELPLKPCSPTIAEDGENDGESKFDWDSHGLQADARIPVRNLDAFKKYKVSYVYLYEVNRQRDLFPVGAEDSLFECVSLRPNRVYTKSQLLKELETLSAALGVFENVDLLAGALPDGTIRIGIFIFSELSASAASPLNTVITPIMSELPLKPCENDDESKFDWDSHGLQADATIPVRSLDAFKKYKVSYVYLYEVNSQRDLFPVGAEDSLFECVSLRPNGVYTKSQLLKELEALSALGVFENVDLMAGTHPDGTICIVIYISEWEWLSANSIKCINVGLLPPWQPMEMSPNMTDEREQMEYIRSMEREYNRRVDEASSSRRPCLLPKEVEEEVSRMLAERNSVTSRLLNRVRDRVQKWYHDQGYTCAQVVNFGNLNTKEVVCEVMEGDITQLVIQFQDKLGNPVEGDTRLEVVERELRKEMQEGHVFNVEAAKQAMANILSLDLISNIEVQPRLDENNEGGLIVEIKLEVPEQESALSGVLSARSPYVLSN